MIAEEQRLKGTLSGGQSLKGNMKDIPSVDKTLTKEGYAADSKAVGDALATKANETHQHKREDITDFPKSLPASDVYEWAKQPQKPSYTASEVKARPDTWMPTASEVGAVPASMIYKHISTAGDADELAQIDAIIAERGTAYGIQNVFYLKVNRTVSEGATAGLGGGDHIYTVKTISSGYVQLTAERPAANGLRAHRWKIDGVWSANWDWENPLMTSGREYRTSDRINEKVVYKKLESGKIRYRLDGETAWNDYAPLMGALPLSGGTMAGRMNMGKNAIENADWFNRVRMTSLIFGGENDLVRTINICGRSNVLVMVTFNSGYHAFYNAATNNGLTLSSVEKIAGNVDGLSFAINTENVLTITCNTVWSYGFAIWSGSQIATG